MPVLSFSSAVLWGHKSIVHLFGVKKRRLISSNMAASGQEGDQAVETVGSNISELSDAK